MAISRAQADSEVKALARVSFEGQNFSENDSESSEYSNERSNDITGKYHEVIPALKSDKSFPCGECGKGFQTSETRRVHLVRSHGDPKYLCEFCDKRFVTPSDLRRHEASINGERPYKCKVCGSTFGDKSHEREHAKTHSKLKRFKCTQCPYETHFDRRLSVHKRSHSGERPFQCPQCDSTFSDGSSHKRHLVSKHSNQPKRFQCEELLCAAAFHSRANLKTHTLTHTEEKPFACPQCDHRTSRSADLKTHINRKHSDLVTPQTLT